MKRTLGLFALLGVVLMPTAHAYAITQTDLYDSYALAHAETALGLDASTTVNTDTSVEVGEDIRADIDAGAAVDTDSSADTNSDATLEEGATFEFSREDMTGDISITSADMVSSQTDLEAFVSNEMQEDDRIDRVEFSNTSVSVWYKHPAKFLGFIPMDMTVEAVADASGDVMVKYPWYSFLLSKNDKAEVEATLEERMEVQVIAETTSTFSTRSQAQVLSDLRAALAVSAE